MWRSSEVQPRRLCARLCSAAAQLLVEASAPHPPRTGARPNERCTSTHKQYLFPPQACSRLSKQPSCMRNSFEETHTKTDSYTAQSRLLHDVLYSSSATVFQLLAPENQPLPTGSLAHAGWNFCSAFSTASEASIFSENLAASVTRRLHQTLIQHTLGVISKILPGPIDFFSDRPLRTRHRLMKLCISTSIQAFSVDFALAFKLDTASRDSASPTTRSPMNNDATFVEPFRIEVLGYPYPMVSAEYDDIAKFYVSAQAGPTLQMPLERVGDFARSVSVS